MDIDTAVITVESWPQALVAVALIIAVLIWPGVLGWMNAKGAKRESKRAAIDAKSAAADSAAVRKTVTQNNSGSNAKDQWDRIERGIAGLQDWRRSHTFWAEKVDTKLDDDDSRLDSMERSLEDTDQKLQGISTQLAQVIELITTPPPENK